MRKWMEKSFIVLFCLYHTYKLNGSNDLAIYFLICLIISLGLDLILNKGVKLSIYTLFGVLSIINPTFIFYLPLILYNMYDDYHYFSFIPILFMLVSPSIPTIFLSFFSIYLSMMNIRFYTLMDKSTQVRDGLKEDALSLRRYNEQLNIDKEKDIHIAILSERNRIARVLHDSIGHSLSSSLLQVEALKIGIGASPVHDFTHIKGLESLQQTLNSGMNDIRNNIHHLYNESFDLEDKINQLIEEVSALSISLIYKIDDDLSFQLKFDILSVIKESITNCIKHSNSTALSIKLIGHQNFYSIVIKDNGSNITMNDSYLTEGMGLSSISEIASKYKGFVNFNYNQGFHIHLTLMKG